MPTEAMDMPAQLRLGMTRDEVVAVLGEPDDTGGTSRKYRTPSVYLYGSKDDGMELWFESWKNGKLVEARRRIPWPTDPPLHAAWYANRSQIASMLEQGHNPDERDSAGGTVSLLPTTACPSATTFRG